MNWVFPAPRSRTIWKGFATKDSSNVRREGTFLWYSANARALESLLTFLYAECCTRNKAVKPESIVKACRCS